MLWQNAKQVTTHYYQHNLVVTNLPSYGGMAMKWRRKLENEYVTLPRRNHNLIATC